MSHLLNIAGTRLQLDGKSFFLQGLSFFNALFNPSFNTDADARLQWLMTFKSFGVNTLRVWCQWDFNPAAYGFIDVAEDSTLFTREGEISDRQWKTLEDLLDATDKLGMAIILTLFANERRPNLPVAIQEVAAGRLARRILPYRHVILQIWNENSTETRRYYEAVKAEDLLRIVTSSPGRRDSLAGLPRLVGDDDHNQMLDVLTPHTTREKDPPFYDAAPQHVAYLLEKYRRPVIDDEPARNGIVRHGGIEGGTSPAHHISQIARVREVGGYSVYHHDMFQTGYGSPSVPRSGIPEPEFSQFHQQVFEYLRDHPTW